MEDSKIIELFFNKDEQALHVTKEKYGKLLESVSFNILGNTPDAEECVNDTWLKLWNTIPPTNPENLSAYACKIARNLSINKLKYLTAEKRGAGKYNAVLEELSDIIPSCQNVEQETELSALTQTINRFLNSLSKQNRIIFVKRYWFFKTDEEISRELSVSQAKVRTSLSRTRKKLKDFLIKEGYEI